MTSGFLKVERRGALRVVTLDRTDKANALSDELVEALIAAVREAEAQDAQVIAFRGAGRNFSAGFDFSGIEEMSDAMLLKRFVRMETLLQAIDASPCLTVGLAHGRNFGAAVDLFAACKWRIATGDAAFRMPGLAFGIVLGTRRFANLVGRDNARAILERLEVFDAARAKEIGFVQRIEPQERWDAVLDEALAVAGKLSPEHRATLYRTLDAGQRDADMASLARSAAEPGLQSRIKEYLANQKR